MSPEINITYNESITIRDWLAVQSERGRSVKKVVSRAINPGDSYNVDGEPLILYADFHFRGMNPFWDHKLVTNDALMTEIKNAGLIKTELAKPKAGGQ